jgi:hypothetical protein
MSDHELEARNQRQQRQNDRSIWVLAPGWMPMRLLLPIRIPDPIDLSPGATTLEGPRARPQEGQHKRRMGLARWSRRVLRAQADGREC